MASLRNETKCNLSCARVLSPVILSSSSSRGSVIVDLWRDAFTSFLLPMRAHTSHTHTVAYMIHQRRARSLVHPAGVGPSATRCDERDVTRHFSKRMSHGTALLLSLIFYSLAFQTSDWLTWFGRRGFGVKGRINGGQREIEIL